MKFSGIITAISPEANGTSRSGKQWRKIEACLTYDSFKPEWPKAIVFSVMNDNIDKFGLQPGMAYDIDVDFSVREYQGRHYMSATCWHAEPKITVQAQQPQAQMQMQVQQASTQQGGHAVYMQPPPPPSQGYEDLPF